MRNISKRTNILHGCVYSAQHGEDKHNTQYIFLSAIFFFFCNKMPLSWSVVPRSSFNHSRHSTPKPSLILWSLDPRRDAKTKARNLKCLRIRHKYKDKRRILVIGWLPLCHHKCKLVLQFII
jgi:hypothetical protein